MKKFIFIFILLIIAAGVAGYFGWVNIKPGTFGIAHSTLTGTVNYPLESGKIYWFWQKLIPKSFHLYIVEKEPVTIDIDITYSLPGSEQLDEFGRFDLNVLSRIEYSMDFEVAKLLIDRGIFSDFKTFFKDQLSSQMEEVISQFILENLVQHPQYEQEISYGMLDALAERLEMFIDSSIQQYKLKNSAWYITYHEIPQIDLYNKAVNRYFAHIEQVYRFKEEELSRQAEYLAKLQKNDLEIDRWRKYGELISQYPELLKYFYIEKFSEQADVLVLPQDEATGFPRMLEPTPPYKKDFIPFEKEEPTLEHPAPQEKLPEPSMIEPPEHELQQEEGTDEPQERKWYESLMFWKNIGEPQGE